MTKAIKFIFVVWVGMVATVVAWADQSINHF